MIDQIEEIEDLGIPSIVLSTKEDVALPIGEAVFSAVEDFCLGCIFVSYQASSEFESKMALP